MVAVGHGYHGRPRRERRYSIGVGAGRCERDGWRRSLLACGVVSGPLFVTAFTAIGSRRAGYDWRRHAVSSLGAGPDGWLQRANFMLVGSLFCLAAVGVTVTRAPKRFASPRAVPPIIAAAGLGLISSGWFVTDPLGGYPHVPLTDVRDPAPRSSATTREGRLHNLSAMPIFIGIPLAALMCAAFSARRREFVWAGYSAGSGVAMTVAFFLFGAAFGQGSRLAGWGGAFQRLSIAAGFGWVSAFSVRSLAHSPNPGDERAGRWGGG
jgi:hypothetical protein